jgi:pilus assembly protein TadC
VETAEQVIGDYRYCRAGPVSFVFAFFLFFIISLTCFVIHFFRFFLYEAEKNNKFLTDLSMNIKKKNGTQET